MDTLVIQSRRPDAGPAWLEPCLASVQAWAESHGYAYRLLGDELLDLVPGWARAKAGAQTPVAADWARLEAARGALAGGWRRVVWLDADVLVFDAAALSVDVEDSFAFGAEVWVQRDRRGRLAARRNVHNALCVFRAGNPVLDFYADACRRVLARYREDGMPPQLLGPKLLTGLDRLTGLPQIAAVGMASPLVQADLARGGGPALDLLAAKSRGRLAALNLCASLAGRRIDGVDVTPALTARAVERLLAAGVATPSGGFDSYTP